MLILWRRELTKLSNQKLDEVNKKFDDSAARQHSEETQKIISWVSPLSFHATHYSILESGQTGTGAWFLEHQTYRKWANGRTDMLWCPGIRKFQMSM